jgi:hypothetical protein
MGLWVKLRGDPCDKEGAICPGRRQERYAEDGQFSDDEPDKWEVAMLSDYFEEDGTYHLPAMSEVKWCRCWFKTTHACTEQRDRELICRSQKWDEYTYTEPWETGAPTPMNSDYRNVAATATEELCHEICASRRSLPPERVYTVWKQWK